MTSEAKLYRQDNKIQRPITFRFGDECLDYDGKFYGGSIRYSEIAGPLEHREDNYGSWQANAFSFFVLMFTGIVFRSLEPEYGMPGFAKMAATLAIVAGLILAGRWVIRNVIFVRRTIIPTDRFEIWVKHDKNHDAIIEELGRRRLLALKGMAKPDPRNTFEEERAKLAWLRDQNAIDDVELQFLLDGLRRSA